MRKIERELVSPEREELNKRIEYFELEIRRRRMAANAIWVGAMAALGFALAVIVSVL